MERQLPDALGWEHSGVERDVGRVRRWALPVAAAHELRNDVLTLVCKARALGWQQAAGSPFAAYAAWVQLPDGWRQSWASRDAVDWSVP